jgi:nucleotide-binding universal stress UspA family protein
VVPPHASPAPRADWPRHVVVATGGDAHTDEALALLTDLAVPGADGLVLTVDEPVAVSTSRLAGAGAAGGGGGAFGVAAVVARLRATGRALVVDHVSGARPARAVANAAAVRGADLVAVATHGDRGVERAFGGSVAEEVVARATCPVWVAHLCC